MGKCSGLKGGGHHRKALDVAEKKKNEKAARKKEQVESGKTHVILKEILTTIDPDGRSGGGLPGLCRANFRYEGCTNKRCKFSHEHSISEALANVLSGTNQATDDDGPPTIPALRHLPGILGDNLPKKKRLRRPRQIPDHPSESEHLSALEKALSEGSSAIDTIVSCLGSDRDVVRLGISCRHLYSLVLEGTDGEGCPDVKRRKFRVKEQEIARRKAALLATRALAGGLRYAVGYFETKKSGNQASKNKTKKNKQHKSLRPILIFDYENPNVYKAFQASGFRKTYNNLDMVSSLAKDCTI